MKPPLTEGKVKTCLKKQTKGSYLPPPKPAPLPKPHIDLYLKGITEHQVPWWVLN